MKKTVLLMITLLVGFVTFAQDNNIKVQKQDGLYHVTLFHDNGEIAQVGYVTENKKLHGIWTMFDTEGKRVSRGRYEDGKKIGTWHFWKEDAKALTQVSFGKDYRIANVVEKQTNYSQLADTDMEE